MSMKRKYAQTYWTPGDMSEELARCGIAKASNADLAACMKAIEGRLLDVVTQAGNDALTGLYERWQKERAL